MTSPLLSFLSLHRQKKHVALQFSRLFVGKPFIKCVADIFYIFQISDLIGIYFKKRNYVFWGKGGRISKTRDSDFIERPILRSLGIFACVLLQKLHSGSFRAFAVFLTKVSKQYVTKTLFCQGYVWRFF